MSGLGPIFLKFTCMNLNFTEYYLNILDTLSIKLTKTEPTTNTQTIARKTPAAFLIESLKRSNLKAKSKTQ